MSATLINQLPEWMTETVPQPEDPAGELMMIIWAQHEGYANGWWDVWCVENEKHHEISKGPDESVSEFAERMFKAGWCVYSRENFHAICPACSNREDTAEYSAQYRNGAGGILG